MTIAAAAIRHGVHHAPTAIGCRTMSVMLMTPSGTTRMPKNVTIHGIVRQRARQTHQRRIKLFWRRLSHSVHHIAHSAVQSFTRDVRHRSGWSGCRRRGHGRGPRRMMPAMFVGRCLGKDERGCRDKTDNQHQDQNENVKMLDHNEFDDLGARHSTTIVTWSQTCRQRRQS